MAWGRGRTTGSLGGADPLWSRAPFVLLRYPGLFIAIAVGALLLALAAAAYPLFISVSASGLVKARIHDPSYTPWAVGMMYRNGAMPLPGSGPQGDVERRADGLITTFMGQSPYLAPAVESALAKVVPVRIPGRQQRRETRLFTGDQALANVQILEGSRGDGAMVPDLVADALGISPGDEIVLGSPGEGTVRLGVDGIYRSLYRGGATGYWRPWNDELVLYCSNCPPPPQAVIVPRQRFLAAARALGLDHAAFAWQARLTKDLTLQQAEDAAGISAGISRRIEEQPILDRCPPATFCTPKVRPVWGSSIDEVVHDVHGRLVAIEGPARLLRVAGVLVALVVVAGAGAFAMAARRVESTLLFARGARPRAVGGRAALEAVLPCAAGAAAGVGLAFGLVRGFGPRGAVAASASIEGLSGAAIAALAAVLAIGVVSTVSFLRQSEHHRSRLRILAAFPWEVVLIGLALVVLDRLRSGGAVTVDRSLGTETPSLLLFAFPVLFLGGFAALAARIIVLALRAVRGRSARWRIPAFLAVHRLSARARLTMLLIAASGLCLGLFVEAQTVARSMDATVDAKAGVYVGSDVEVRIDSINETPRGFPQPLTRVVRRLQAGELRPRVPYDLLAIDPETFASAAFWDPAFSSASLQALLDRLSGPSGAALPIVVAAAPDANPTRITLDTQTLPVEVVGRTEAFPGMSSLRPLVVVDADRLLDAFEGRASPLHGANTSDELWIRGDPDAIRNALPELDYAPELVLTTGEVKDIPYISAVIDTFLVMDGLGLLAALLVFAAMLMYLQARQRSEIVSYGLSLRMGMRSSSHLLAIAIEVGILLIVAYLVGSALAIAAAWLTVPLLDPIEAVPPEPIAAVPAFVVAVAAPVLLLATLAGGWLTERRARAADLGQVMRLAD